MQDDIVLGGGEKSRFNWKIFGIIMTALTVFALVFGVVMILVKNDEIAKVKAEYGAGQPVDPDESGDERGNPVVKAELPASYILNEVSLSFEISENNFAYLNLRVKDGAIIECSMDVINNSDNYTLGACQIDGVEGQIYKVVGLLYSDAERADNALGLIMTDGSVVYVPLDGGESRTFSAKGKLKIDGVVVDALEAEIKPNEYLEESYYGTVFVMRSGEILKYDLTMLEGM